MSIYLIIAFSLFAGYFLGSINTSIIVGKINGIDIRSKGSGNAGTTNTLRTLGKKAAAFVLLGDILKSVAACLVGLYIANIAAAGADFGYLGKLAGGLGAIFGHNWPVYFHFRGGKGILTSFAAIVMIDYRAALILLCIFILVLLITKYVSAGSILAAILLPVVFILIGNNTYEIIFALITALLAVWRHSSNITRLLKGTESKINFRRTG